MAIQDIKQKFGIIGSAPLLDRAIDIAKQVAPQFTAMNEPCLRVLN